MLASLPLLLLSTLLCASAQRVAIFGSSGYIGSHLLGHLQGAGLDAWGYDPAAVNGTRLRSLAAHGVSAAELRAFDAVVYLGGLAGRSACSGAASAQAVAQANVEDVAALALRLLPSQLLLFASSAALSVGSGAAQADEQAPLHAHLFDRYEASMLARELRLRHLAQELGEAFPRAVGLRFGTVVGVSPRQRTDLLHMRMGCSALTSGSIQLRHPETVRSVLWLEDASRAVASLIARPPSPRFAVLNLQSHWSTVSAAANALAAATRARVAASEHAPAPDDAGFSLSTAALTAATGYQFEGTPTAVLQDLLPALPEICAGAPLRAAGAPPCAICGSHDMMPVLDLAEQPLANDFFNTTASALACETFPLAIARCRACQHTQLTHFVDRARLFRDYKYVSGTTSTGRDYFSWMARKVIEEVAAAEPARRQRGAVLDIACNDGSQLNPFRDAGWDTHCVDPAANLAPLARAAGHKVQVAFWGVDAVQLPPLDAILAQNVLAHVLNPMDFVRAAARAMGPATRLYLQTSQCEMYDTGQFDTIYHEHVSFFSAHSFARMADLAGLRVVGFEKVPIHGVSCLVTLMRREEPLGALAAPAHSAALHAPALTAELSREAAAGLTTDFFYLRYRAQAQGMRAWMHRILGALSGAGYELAGFGAAAKGMVLLHYLLAVPGRQWSLSFVVDESPFKQGTFCPGTDIPVVPAAALAQRGAQGARARPLVLIVLAWNFAEEILRKIAAGLRNTTTASVLAILPFPHQRLVRLDTATGAVSALLANPAALPPWPTAPPAPPTFAVLLLGKVRKFPPLFCRVRAHAPASPPFTFFHTPIPLHIFLQGTAFLPHWIRHHAHMFDRVVMVAFGSSGGDNSTGIAAAEAPAHWELRRAQEGISEDGAVAAAEDSAPPGSWRITLEPFEFLVHQDLRSLVAEAAAAAAGAAEKASEAVLPDGSTLLAPSGKQHSANLLRLPSFTMDCGGAPPPRFASPLLHCTRYLVEARAGGSLRAGEGPSSRLLHSLPGLRYAPGRRGSQDPAHKALMSSGGFIARFEALAEGVHREALVPVELRAVLPLPEELGARTPAMLAAQAAWVAFFAQDAPLLFGEAERPLRRN